jgi:hypothetical protein
MAADLAQVRLLWPATSRYSAWALSPKVGAGCVSSARPDLWRGSRAIAIPTPTGPQALKGQDGES